MNSALIGVAVGILGGILATAVTDHLRWRREQSVRWDERRLDAYAEYSTAIKDIHRLTLRIVEPGLASPAAQSISRDAGLKMLDEADTRRTLALEAVLLLGDTPTIAAAKQWRNAEDCLELFARDHINDEKFRQWRAAVENADRTRERFYTVARKSLDVHGGSVE